MKTSFKIEGERAYFIITELEPEYHDAVRGLYFFDYRGGFAKDFPTDIPNLDRIFQNFQRHAEEEVLQAARVRPIPWEKALTTFIGIVKDTDIDWWLTGSAALSVRGIDIIPGDIDLTVAERDCMRLGELLADYLIEPSMPVEGWIANWFGRTFMGARLEWVGGVHDSLDVPDPGDCGPLAEKMLETVNWNGVEIRVPPLELQLSVNERRGLTERVEKIKQFQQSQT